MVQRIVEHKDASERARAAIGEIYSGIMACRGWLCAAGWRGCATDNAQGELYLTDIVASSRSHCRTRAGGAPHQRRVQVAGGTARRSSPNSERAFQRRQADELMVAGVRLADPARFDLRGELVCGQDVEIDGLRVRGPGRARRRRAHRRQLRDRNAEDRRGRGDPPVHAHVDGEKAG